MAAVYEISTDRRFASSLRYVVRRVSRARAECECVQESANGRSCVVIRGGAGLGSVIADALADIIITDCKAHYINERIRLPIRDRLARHAFTSALSTFDRDTDKIIAKSILDNFTGGAGCVCRLDGLYEFRLDALKSRWEEVCLLANENICYLVCQRTFLELLRFLISNIDGISDEVHVVRGAEGLEVLGPDLTPIEGIYINESLPADIRVVGKLIAIAPKRIFLHADHPTLAGHIKNLFGTCTVVN